MRDEDIVKALEYIDRNGEAAPGNDPSAYSLNALIERDHLARWDDDAGRMVLTLSGRQRLTQRHAPVREPGVVTPFRGGGATPRKDRSV